MKIVVLGAGVMGVTTAYYLNKLGHEVTVIERNDKSAAECSFANGGQLSYSHAEPWATPYALKKIPRWLMAKDSPLVLRPNIDPYMWKWAIKFARNCTDIKKEESTRHTLRLALHSRDCFAQIIKDTNIQFFYSEKGTLHTFRNEMSLAGNIAQAEFQKQIGCDYQVLQNRAECEKLEPALKYAPAEIIGGIYFPMDATGDVNEFTVNLASYLKEKGVQFLYGQNVEEILNQGDKIVSVKTNKAQYKADSFVVCLGAATPLLLRKIGMNVPIYPMKGYSLSIDIKNMDKTPIAGITDQHNKIVYSRLGNILRVAGTAEFDRYNSKVSSARIATLKRMVGELFPQSGDVSSAREWACLRPSTPEGTPIIGKTSYKNLYMNTGHGTLGWTLSCGSAQIIADIIGGNNAAIDMSGLTLEKY